MTVGGDWSHAKNDSSSTCAEDMTICEVDKRERLVPTSLCTQLSKAIECGKLGMVERVLVENADLELGNIKHLLFTRGDKPYTRNLLFENERFSVLALVWRGGAKSSIHAHEGSSCWVRVVHGSLWEQVYAEEETESGKRLNLTEQRMLEAGGERSCAYVDDSLGVHCMANGSLGDLSVSVHVYAPPFYSCNVFSDAVKANVRSAHIELDAVYGRALHNGLAVLT